MISPVATSPISDLSFTKGENLTDERFSPEELLASEQVIAQFLTDSFPSLDFFEDSTIYDLVVRPSSVIYLIFRRQMETFRQTMSVKDVQENPGLADPDVVAAILSNYLISLNSGSPARGVAKVQVSSDRTFRFRQGMVFTTAEGLRFSLDESLLTTTSDTPAVGQIRMVRPDPSVENWVFYLPLTAVESGSIYNIPSGTNLALPAEIDDVSLVAANLDFSGGSEGDSFSGLGRKILDSLSARNLVSRSSIFSSIRDMVPELTAVMTQGMGDDLILRNRNTLMGTPVGGVVDIYVRTSGPPAFITIDKTATQVEGTPLNYSMTITRDEVPGHYFIRAVRPSGGPYLGTYEVKSKTVRINTKTTNSAGREVHPNIINNVIEGTYSRWQETDVVIEVEPYDIQVMSGPEEISVSVEFFYMPHIDTIQDIVSADDTRVAGTDYLVRGFVPCFVGLSSVNIKVTSKTQVTADIVRAAISSYIHSIPPGRGIRVDDIVSTVRGIAGVVSVDLPIKITGEVYAPDPARTRITYHSRSVLDVPTDVSLGFGPQNTAFFVEPGQIPITITEQ